MTPAALPAPTSAPQRKQITNPHEIGPFLSKIAGTGRRVSVVVKSREAGAYLTISGDLYQKEFNWAVTIVGVDGIGSACVVFATSKVSAICQVGSPHGETIHLSV
jgi:hypothetical protein